MQVDSWNIFDGGVNGWSANQIEIGKGNIYNSKWGNTQITELDANANEKYTQTFKNLKRGEGYELKFSYAARSGFVNTSGAKVYWNGEVIQEYLPEDDEIHHVRVVLHAKDGTNVFAI